MSKRVVVVGGATAVAGLVLGASIVFGPDAATPNNTGIQGQVNTPRPGSNPTGNPDDVGVNARGVDYVSLEPDDDGNVRRIRLRATQMNVKPLGVSELIRPRVDIGLGPRRAITITADKADMDMEDRKPRAGQFSGNVVVTIFESPEGVELITEPDDPRHAQFVQQRIFLDQTTDFSVEDNSISTQGPVHLTSPEVDFFGIGLRLLYNTQRERIEQLLVNEGRYLFYNPEAEALATQAEAQDSEGQDTAGDTETQSADANDAEADNPAETQAPPQFYGVTFRDDVIVRDGLESELGGQVLVIDFAMGGDTIRIEPSAPSTGTTPAPSPALPNGRLAQADTTLATGPPKPIEPPAAGDATATPLPIVAIPTRNSARSLFKYKPERDVTVLWTGPMRVLPHDRKPDALADADDVRVQLTGENAYAQTTRNGDVERLETLDLEYLLSQERTTALASPAKPLRIVSTALGGEITGQRLTVRQQEKTATILGPGQLTYTDPETKKPLTLTWQNRLDLELYTEDKDPDAAATPTTASTDQRQTKITGVKTATFDGEVTATHPDFDLSSDKLTIAFIEPDEKKKIDNTPSEINASGSIAINARGDAEDEVFDISAQRLTIALATTAEGDTYASAIRAIGGVDVKRPGMELTCARVNVELNPPNTSQKQGEQDGSADQALAAEVRKIVAVGDVRGKIDRDDRRIDLVADQLIGDIEHDKLTLSANSLRQPAEVIDIGNDRKLTGDFVVMDDRADVLTITGPGSLTSKLTDPNDPDAGIENAYLTIQWAGSMKFNNVTGEAEFIDEVQSVSRRSIDASELNCDHLAMRFSPDYEHDPARLIDDDGEDNHDRQVRSAIATGNVKFMAAGWEPNKPRDITNRLRLEGPKVIFTNQPARAIGQTPTETVIVRGEGRMVLEDYRPPEEAEANNEADAPEQRTAFMTGRGATLFAWEDKMVLDALQNTATLTQAVEMVHIPRDDDGRQGDTVTLQCERLVADMTDTGGLSVWMSDDAPDAQVKMITADGKVVLTQSQQRSMSSDHLKYEAATEQVVLWADDNRAVVLQDLVRDATTLTNKITWHLTNDRIEIDELRGGVQPLN